MLGHPRHLRGQVIGELRFHGPVVDIPLDLASVLDADAKILALWERLRPPCQCAYAASMLEAKRADTPERRIAAVVKATLEWSSRHPPKVKARTTSWCPRPRSASSAPRKLIRVSPTPLRMALENLGR